MLGENRRLSLISALALGVVAYGCADSAPDYSRQAEEQARSETAEEAPADSASLSVSDSDTALQVDYDRFENRTEVESPTVAGPQFNFSASYVCSGEPGCRPDRVFLQLNPGPEYSEPNNSSILSDEFDELRKPPEGSTSGPPIGELIFLLDGSQRIRVGDRAREVAKQRESPIPCSPPLDLSGIDVGPRPAWCLSDGYNEGSLTAAVPFNVFRAFAEADSVEFRLNQVEASLTRIQKVVLERMVRLVRSPGN